MTTLMKASNQWATRPDDERFTSLFDMRNHFHNVRDKSAERVVNVRKIEARPDPADPHKGFEIVGPAGNGYAPTHWAFGQLAQLAEAPGGYLRTIPAPLAADCINYGLKFKRNIEDVGLLLVITAGGAKSLFPPEKSSDSLKLALPLVNAYASPHPGSGNQF